MVKNVTKFNLPPSVPKFPVRLNIIENFILKINFIDDGDINKNLNILHEN